MYQNRNDKKDRWKYKLKFLKKKKQMNLTQIYHSWGGGPMFSSGFKDFFKKQCNN